jgi:hypothetical protein
VLRAICSAHVDAIHQHRGDFGVRNATVGMYDMLDSQIRIVGNTFADNEGIAAVMLWNTSSDAWFVDNIAWNNGGHDFDVIVDSGAAVAGQARFKTNLLQSYRGVPVGDSGGDLVNVDPLFVDAAAGNYRVQNASPAVNSGVAPAPADGPDGKSRTIGRRSIARLSHRSTTPFRRR